MEFANKTNRKMSLLLRQISPRKTATEGKQSCIWSSPRPPTVPFGCSLSMHLLPIFLTQQIARKYLQTSNIEHHSLSWFAARSFAFLYFLTGLSWEYWKAGCFPPPLSHLRDFAPSVGSSGDCQACRKWHRRGELGWWRSRRHFWRKSVASGWVLASAALARSPALIRSFRFVSLAPVTSAVLHTLFVHLKRLFRSNRRGDSLKRPETNSIAHNLQTTAQIATIHMIRCAEFQEEPTDPIRTCQ